MYNRLGLNGKPLGSPEGLATGSWGWSSAFFEQEVNNAESLTGFAWINVDNKY